MIKDIKRMRSEKGFTLIELLVVIVILGILAAVVVFAVGGLSDKGESSSCKIDTRTLKTAEEAFNAKFGVYALTLATDGTDTDTDGAAAGDVDTDAATSGEDKLIAAGLLDEVSSLHNIATVGTSYEVEVVDKDCGTPDDPATAGVNEGLVIPANTGNK